MNAFPTSRNINGLRMLVFGLVVLSSLTTASAVPDFPRNTVYQLNVPLTDQDGTRSIWRANIAPISF